MTNKDKAKIQKYEDRIYFSFFRWIDAWLSILDSIVCICTLGFIYPSLSWEWTMYYIKLKAKKRGVNESKS